MAEKIFSCGVCGKEIAVKEKNTRFTQIQYRTVTQECAWESQWKTLCENCFDNFQRWLNGKKGDDIRGA